MFWRMTNEWVSILTPETLSVSTGMYLAIAKTKVVKDSKSRSITGDSADGLLQCTLMETVVFHAFKFLVLLP